MSILNENVFYTFQSLPFSNCPSERGKSLLFKSMFCFSWGIKLTSKGCFSFGCFRCFRITLPEDNTLTEREGINYYFCFVYSYKDIVHLIKSHFNISLNERKLKRQLQKYNLRKNSNTDDSVFHAIIRKKIKTP